VLKIVYDAENGKLLGAQAVGGAGVDKRLDVLSTVLHFGGTVRDLAGLDLAYAPPFSSAKDPIHMAGFAASNDLDGLDTLLPPDADLSGKQVVDVRNDDEYNELHIEGVVHIPVNMLRDNLQRLDAKRDTVVLCHSGARAHVAARILSQHGFKQVSNLSGGMLMRRRAQPKGIVYGKKR
jgi:rhodanese-related sulfurtransferase